MSIVRTATLTGSCTLSSLSMNALVSLVEKLQHVVSAGIVFRAFVCHLLVGCRDRHVRLSPRMMLYVTIQIIPYALAYVHLLCVCCHLPNPRPWGPHTCY